MVTLIGGCGQAIPALQSSVPTATARVTPTTTGTATPTPTITTTPTPGPSPTPDTRATSDAVFATITALAATPTYPPTSTPRPQRTPIGAGPEEGDVQPTPLFSSNGITVQTISAQVLPGGPAALTIKAKPAAVCALGVDRGGPQPEPVPGIATRTAGHDGAVAWIWTVAADEPAGMMKLVVDCGAAGRAELQMKVAR
jgi:hypothetical protein